ncbi:MAG: DUF1838 family protein [Rhodobacteraceae bacterium]|nr:DUF1838 family protein [Paracoccaceae bacterium]
MADHELQRRSLLAGTGMGILSMAGLGVPELTRPRMAMAANTDGLDDFTTFIKIYSSIAPGRHWWWFTGRWDLIAPGHTPVPLVGFDTLIRREVKREDGGVNHTRGWEGMVFWDLQSRELIDTMTNPINGREISPHYTKEGPTNTRTSKAGFHIGAGAEGPQTRPIDFPRTVVGDAVWIERAMNARAPHPMKPAEWKLESSGELYWTNIVSILRGKISEVNDPNVQMASADYIIGGQSVPLPWMLMGQSGAMVGWTGYGRKLFTLDDLPARSRRWYEERHPELFGDAEPWTEYNNAFHGFMAARTPTAP